MLKHFRTTKTTKLCSYKKRTCIQSCCYSNAAENPNHEHAKGVDYKFNYQLILAFTCPEPLKKSQLQRSSSVSRVQLKVPRIMTVEEAEGVWSSANAILQQRGNEASAVRMAKGGEEAQTQRRIWVSQRAR